MAIPREADFSDFRKQCLSMEGWYSKYNKNGMEVWVEMPSLTSNKEEKNNIPKVHKIKVFKSVTVVYVLTYWLIFTLRLSSLFATASGWLIDAFTTYL